jgi:hypothetical protein
MNALITPLLFSRFDTTAPAGLVPASSALALFRFANFAIIYFKKSGSALPVKLAIPKGKKGNFLHVVTGRAFISSEKFVS